MEADLNLLETARRCELYGVKMHLVKVITRLADSNQLELLACLFTSTPDSLSLSPYQFILITEFSF